MQNGARLRTLALSMILAFLAACSSVVGGPGDRTSVTLRLTDAPGEVLAAVVTITEITLHGETGPTVNLLDEPITTDLVPLALSPLTLVNGLIIPDGEYSSLRFVMTGGYLEVEDDVGGSVFYPSSPTYAALPSDATIVGDLQMPSLGSSGLKVQFGGQDKVVISGLSTTLTVDFDVSESFGKVAGQSGKWVMHPSLKGTQTPPQTP